MDPYYSSELHFSYQQDQVIDEGNAGPLNNNPGQEEL